jgi:hypothetical protein
MKDTVAWACVMHGWQQHYFYSIRKGDSECVTTGRPSDQRYTKDREKSGHRDDRSTYGRKEEN